jgi:hypothetical protein
MRQRLWGTVVRVVGLIELIFGIVLLGWAAYLLFVTHEAKWPQDAGALALPVSWGIVFILIGRSWVRRKNAKQTEAPGQEKGP